MKPDASVDAQNNLGVAYANGLGVAKNDAEAMKWFRKAAEKEYEYRAGPAYDDTAGAAKWLRKAAEQGNIFAAYYLGRIYTEGGEGVAENKAKAAIWFRKAAEQGYVDAQFQLGEMYYSGEGVAKNHAEAAKWYRKAAKQGHEDAQKALKSMEK